MLTDILNRFVQEGWGSFTEVSDSGIEGVSSDFPRRRSVLSFVDGVSPSAVCDGIQLSIDVMIRALFFGLGAFVGLWGMSLVAVDGVVLSVAEDAQPSRVLEAVSQVAPDGRRMIDPPDWIGFTLVGMGGLTMLYSVALPRS